MSQITEQIVKVRHQKISQLLRMAESQGYRKITGQCAGEHKERCAIGAIASMLGWNPKIHNRNIDAMAYQLFTRYSNEDVVQKIWHMNDSGTDWYSISNMIENEGY